jgi:hypothetical protein
MTSEAGGQSSTMMMTRHRPARLPTLEHKRRVAQGCRADGSSSAHAQNCKVAGRVGLRHRVRVADDARASRDIAPQASWPLPRTKADHGA